MSLSTTGCCMQDSYVEKIGHAIWIPGTQIFSYMLGLETLTVERNAEFLN
jgi:hypothetical protein